VASIPRYVSSSKTINIRQFTADAGVRTGTFFTKLEGVDVLIRSQAREIFTSSHALANPAEEAGSIPVMVEAGKADA
jgi:hypothetical protein